MENAVPGLSARSRVSGFLTRRVQILGDGARARALRGSFWTVAQFGGEQSLRLASNLVLTRLLFPEAFGLMALVQVFMTGLQMFSDTGIRVSIIQSARGDEPDFLNTAWTIQVWRGVLLWLGACALALPAATIYDEPMLAELLPVAGLSAILLGLQPTAVDTADRHLVLGRVTVLGLVAQVVAIVAMILLAWLLESVWALVLGTLLGGIVRLALLRRFLPGIRNRFRWECTAVSQLFHFGKYVFVSTLFGFLVNNADRIILGAFISMAALGVYNIGFFLASVPLMVTELLIGKVVMPLYRMRPIAESEANRRQIFLIRRLVIGAALAGNLILTFGAVVLVDLLYDARYAAAGPIMVLLGLVFVPRIVFSGSISVLLPMGDSRRFMILIGALAVSQTAFLFIAIEQIGLLGAILAPGFAVLVTAPLRISYARRYRAWDGTGEAVFLASGLGLAGLACWLHRSEILAVFG